MYFTLSGLEPTKFFNPGTWHDILWGTSGMGPAICRFTARLTPPECTLVIRWRDGHDQQRERFERQRRGNGVVYITKDGTRTRTEALGRSSSKNPDTMRTC